MSAAEASLSLDHPADLRAIRDALRFAGYTTEGLTAAFGTAGLAPIARRNVWQIRAAAEKAGSLGALMRVFLTPDAVERERFQDAVAPTDVETWAKVGLVTIADDRVTGNVELRPYWGLIFAVERDGTPAGNGVSAEDAALEQLAIQSGVRSVLDFDAGAGLVGLTAVAVGSDRVVLADPSPRRLQLAKFNAQLNHSHGVEFCESDFPPVAPGRAFDLAIGRAKLVVPPESHPVSEGDGSGDAGLADVLRAAAERIKEGGYAQVLATWLQVAGESEAQRFARWLADLDCDAIVLRESSADPADFAAKRLAAAGLATPSEEYGRAYREGLVFFEKVRAEAIQSGMIVLRKRSHGLNWTTFEKLPAERVGGCGESITKLFQMQDFLRGFSNTQALLDVRLQLAPETYLAQKCEPGDGTWQIFESVLTRKNGLRFAADVGMPVAPLVPQLNGQHTLREMLPALARQFRLPLDQAVSAALDQIVRLVTWGLVVPSPRIQTLL